MFTLKFHDWHLCRQVAESMNFRVFRGQANSQWRLVPSFERIMVANSFPMHFAYKVERAMIEEFIRRAWTHLPAPPRRREYFEWASLLRHHGGPTRLLDFTYSFYVAAFFAIETATEDAAIWSVSLGPIRSLSKRWAEHDLMSEEYRHRRYANMSFLRAPTRTGVIHVEPFKLSERQAVQQSVFLMSTNTSVPFEKVLFLTLEHGGVEDKANEVVVKDQVIEVGQPEDVTQEILTEGVIRMVVSSDMFNVALHDLRKMNVHAAALFPGLDGLARSMRFYPTINRGLKRSSAAQI